MSRKIRNPIIPGYYPDPSMIRVGDDFYLVNSSFELSPALPVFHSRDLVHWEQICNAMTEENGFYVEKNCGVGGVMAPTLRYYDGVYYIINCNFGDRGNFIITAANPAGPWSKPHYLTDVPGIDASMFIDDDGQFYVMGTGDVWDNGAGQMERGIWLAKYDIKNFRMASEPVTIWNSALRVGSSPEAPHIYHVGDYYHLIIAEGGTEHYHAVMSARSKDLFGFYEGNPANPVLTHRHMGFSCPVTNVGHADLVELKDGSWWAVMLASRLIDGKCKNLGRETFACPVVWERDWPLFTPESGRVLEEYDLPECLASAYDEAMTREDIAGPAAVSDAEEVTEVSQVYIDDFDSDELPLHLVFWGTPGEKFWRIEDSALRLRCIKQKLDEELQPMGFDFVRKPGRYAAFVSRRQCQPNVTFSAAMKFTPLEAESAGVAIVQAMNHQIHFERAVSEGQQVLRLVVVSADYAQPPYFPGFTSETHRRVLCEKPWESDEAVLGMELNGEDFQFFAGEDEDHMEFFAKADGTEINPEKVGCMVGTMLGVYATGGGEDSQNEAAFDWIRYEES